MIRVAYEASSIGLEQLLAVWAPRRHQLHGQYRSLVIVAPTQLEHALALVRSHSEVPVPVLSSASPEGRFWDAEDYHQKWRLRGDGPHAEQLEASFGERWDEHSFATKLNAARVPGFDAAPWHAKLVAAARP